MKKYRNKPTDFLNVRFDSQKEASRYQELLWMEKARLIRDIELQPRYDFVINEKKLKHHYIADFRYVDISTGQSVVEDVKSPVTRKLAAYQIKKELMKVLYNIEIVEV